MPSGIPPVAENWFGLQPQYGNLKAATDPYGTSLRRHFRMGISNMEARLLSRETRAKEISELLRIETECRRSQLHLPPVGKRDDRAELDRRNARPFSLHHQGAPGAHAYQAPEER